MNLINSLAHQESLLAQWSEHLTGIWDAMGLIPIPGLRIYKHSKISKYLNIPFRFLQHQSVEDQKQT